MMSGVWDTNMIPFCSVQVSMHLPFEAGKRYRSLQCQRASVPPVKVAVCLASEADQNRFSASLQYAPGYIDLY